MDLSIEQFLSVRPQDYTILSTLELQQEVPHKTPPEITLTIQLRHNDESDRRNLLLTFLGVVNLELRPKGSLVGFSLIEIISIRDFQWENINYKVRDTEEGSLSFYCKEIQVTVLQESP